jgi:hypothetical protein
MLGTEHSDFSDRPVLLPLISLYSPDTLGVRPGSNLGFLTDTGYIDGNRSLEITRNYTGAFFDRYLKNIPSSLLAPTNFSYPEVVGETRNI